MFKSRKILGLCLLMFLVLISACGNQLHNNESADDKKTEDSTTTSSDGDSSDLSLSDNASPNLGDERCDKVLDATLKILSEDGYTTVDFAKKTATRDGKEMIFEIVSIPKDGQTEFQEGLIREKIDDIQSHTLYLFEFDDHNKLTLIEPATSEAVYTEE